MNNNETRSINRLAQRLAVRIEANLPVGRQAWPTISSLYRQFRRDHGEQLDQECLASVEKALGSLLDRVHVNRASLVVAPFHGKPATEIEPEIKLDAVRPSNGNGAEQAHLNF